MTPVGDILLSLMDGARSGLGLPELLCRDAVRRLPISGCGISLMDADGGVEALAGSDERAVGLEGLQLSLGEGPCVEAFASGRLVMVTDLELQGAPRWPGYTPAALEAGVRAIFSYPLRIGGIRMGVFDLFADSPGILLDVDLALALRYVDAAVLILLHLQSLAPTGEPADGELVDHVAPIEIAFRSQPEVHQATGMVSVQAAVGLTDALLLLRAHAFAHDLPIGDVARDVVDRKINFT